MQFQRSAEGLAQGAGPSVFKESMANNNNDDWLIGLGILAAAGIGYLVVRSIDEYKRVRS